MSAVDLDLVVRGGTVVSARGRARLDVGVAAGKVVGLAPEIEPPAACRVVDAAGLLVLPGMVDTHVHLMDPGDPGREDFPTGTAAAALAGVTTIVEHTHGWPVTTVARLQEKRDHLLGRSNVDYGLAAHLWPDQLGEVAALWRAGVVFFKIFTCTTHGVPAVEAGVLAGALEQLGALRAACLVHCEDEGLTAAAEQRLKAAGRHDPGLLPEWRSREAELVAVHALCILAAGSGATVTVAHASNAAVLDAVAYHRSRGAPVVAETCPQYLMLREDEVHAHGALRKFTPPARLRDESDERSMWDRFNAGAVHHLSTDHAPSTRGQKAGDFWQAHFGLPGLDTTLALAVDAALSGRTSLERVVEAYALAPARRYGLEGKGALAPGYDADLVLLDPKAERTLRDEDVVSRAGWTPYAGRRVRGRVLATLLRGEVVASEGRLDAPGSGRLVAGPGAARHQQR